MILILRGHIRSAFNNNQLNNLVKEIYKIDNDLKIYIHTWNIFSSNISWREVNVDNTIVITEKVFDYFNEFRNIIKMIIIDDDKKIKLVGKTDGFVCDTLMPVKGWKNYWYGKYKLIYNMYNVYNLCNILNVYNIYNPIKNIIRKNEVIVNMRFDILNNSNSFNHDIIINFIKSNSKRMFLRNHFLYDNEFTGCDNIYVGNIDTMFKLNRIFFYNLDLIEKNNIGLKNQEFLVMRINDKLSIKSDTEKRYVSKVNLVNKN